MSTPMQRTMRLFFLFSMMLTAPCVPAQDRPDVTPKASSQNPTPAEKGLQKIDLAGFAPEDFDWKAYFANSDHSTSSDYTLATNASQVLRARIDQLCQQYRALMTSRKEVAALAVFDEMQQHWEKFASAEIQFVGSAWEGGSGAKLAYARHRFEVYLRRAKELRALKQASLHLNE